jgi:hypothetical protein
MRVWLPSPAKWRLGGWVQNSPLIFGVSTATLRSGHLLAFHRKHATPATTRRAGVGQQQAEPRAAGQGHWTSCVLDAHAAGLAAGRQQQQRCAREKEGTNQKQNFSRGQRAPGEGPRGTAADYSKSQRPR